MSEFSVLMSVYIGENASNISECFKSLINQTVQAKEWVIVEDGPLKDEVYSILNDYEKNYPGLIKRVQLKKNVGLGGALEEGVKHCSYDIIARMDTDDIARTDRFDKQLDVFLNNPQIDICGSYIDEFITSPDEIVSRRLVPLEHDEIVKYQKKRDGFNHVSVMFKKEAVLKAGNYKSCPLMEDSYLWARMIQSGAVCANINESLVFVRIGKDMFERRGGLSYFKKYKEGRRMIRNTGYIGAFDYYYTLLIQFIVAIMPNKIRGCIFTKVLHRRCKNYH